MDNILFISTESSLVGTTRALNEIIQYVSKNTSYGIKVILGKHGPFEELLKKNSIEYKVLRFYSWVKDVNSGPHFLKRIVKALLSFFSNIYIFFYISKKNIKLVHINTSITNVGYKPAKMRKIPVVWHLREVIFDSLRKEFYNKQKAIKCFNGANLCFCISQYVRNSFEKIGVRNCVTLYDGVDFSSFVPKNKPLFENNKICFTLVGYDEVKGHMQALEAINCLKQSTSFDFTLNFVGKIDNKEYMQKLENYISEHSLSSVVSFLGHRNDMANIWNSTDIALICTRCEGFGRATAEALASECCVIGANSGATPEIVTNNNGYLYKSGDSLSLYKTIVEVLSEPQKAIIKAKQGHIDVTKRFAFDCCGETLINYYHSLLDI